MELGQRGICLWLWVSLSFLGIFLYSSQFWIRYLGWWRAVESWSVSRWHLDSDSCGRRIFRVSPGIMITAEMATVWLLIGHIPGFWLVSDFSECFGDKRAINLSAMSILVTTETRRILGENSGLRLCEVKKAGMSQRPLYLLLWGQFGFIHRISRLFWFFTPSVTKRGGILVVS